MIRILLLSAGTNACYHFAKHLKANFANDFFIIGTDINDKFLIPTCDYIDKFYRVPCNTDKNYYPKIIEICKKEQVNYILPSFDMDQKLFYPENKSLKHLGIKTFGVPQETLNIYKNKVFMNEFLEDNCFKIPKIFDVTEIENDGQYFIKPINGVGSVGAQIMPGAMIKQLEFNKLIVQEICKEPEITLECFTFNGILRSIARKRIASKSGVCTKTYIFNSKELHRIAQNFIKIVKTPNCFNLQFMKNNNDEYVITDVNLRLAGGMSLSAAAGWDEVSALAKIMLNKTENEVFETLPQQIHPQYVVRAYTDIVTKIEKSVIAFDLDGTLLDSRKRHIIVLDDILKKYNIVLDISDLIDFKRDNKNNVDYLISKGINEKLAEEIQKEWIEHIEDEKYLNFDSLYPDAQTLLSQYQNNDLILITARSNEQTARNQINNIGLKNKFKKIFVVATGKDAYKKKAEILQRENAVLMIGDTNSDYKASRLANIDFKFCEKGFNKREIVFYNG